MQWCLRSNTKQHEKIIPEISCKSEYVFFFIFDFTWRTENYFNAVNNCYWKFSESIDHKKKIKLNSDLCFDNYT